MKMCNKCDEAIRPWDSYATIPNKPGSFHYPTCTDLGALHREIERRANS